MFKVFNPNLYPDRDYIVKDELDVAYEECDINHQRNEREIEEFDGKRERSVEYFDYHLSCCKRGIKPLEEEQFRLALYKIESDIRYISKRIKTNEKLIYYFDIKNNIKNEKFIEDYGSRNGWPSAFKEVNGYTDLDKKNIFLIVKSDKNQYFKNSEEFPEFSKEFYSAMAAINSNESEESDYRDQLIDLKKDLKKNEERLKNLTEF